MIRTQSELDAALKAGTKALDLDSTSPLTIRDGKGLTITGRAGIASTPLQHQPALTMLRCTDTMLNGVRLSGADQGEGWNGWGVRADDCTGLEVRGSSFERLHRGIVLTRCAGVTIAHNLFERMQSEGVNGACCDDVLIDGNTFRDFRPQMRKDGSGDHPDAVQFWTHSQPRGCRRVTVRNNLIVYDLIDPPQGIFFNDEVDLWRQGLGHEDITIVDNILVNVLHNAIFVDHPKGCRIEGNTVVSQAGVTALGLDVVPKIRVLGKATMRRNVAPRYLVDDVDRKPVGNTRTLG